jgi:glycosyltransferase involved in cell wall biosynthesis
LNQNYSDFELLVVDDASTDNTEEVVTNYDDPRLTYIQHGMNKGGSAARNTGIKAAKGEYIAFVDSDDEWLPKKLTKQVQCLESRSDDWVAAYCGIKKQRSGISGSLRGLANQLFSDKAGSEGGVELIQYILTMNFPIGAGSTLLVRSKTVDEIGGFDESFQRHQDWEFLIRLLQRGKLAYVNEELTQLHGTGPPDPATLKTVKSHFFERFETLISDHESKGVPVTDYHRLHLARSYYFDAQFMKGTKYLTSAFVFDVKLYMSIIWGIFNGLWRKLNIFI